MQRRRARRHVDASCSPAPSSSVARRARQASSGRGPGSRALAEASGATASVAVRVEVAQGGGVTSTGPRAPLGPGEPAWPDVVSVGSVQSITSPSSTQIGRCVSIEIKVRRGSSRHTVGVVSGPGFSRRIVVPPPERRRARRHRALLARFRRGRIKGAAYASGGCLSCVTHLSLSRLAGRERTTRDDGILQPAACSWSSWTSSVGSADLFELQMCGPIDEDGTEYGVQPCCCSRETGHDRGCGRHAPAHMNDRC